MMNISNFIDDYKGKICFMYYRILLNMSSCFYNLSQICKLWKIFFFSMKIIKLITLNKYEDAMLISVRCYVNKCKKLSRE